MPDRRFRTRLVARDNQAGTAIGHHYARVLAACDRHIQVLTDALASLPAGKTVPISWLYERDRLASLRTDVQREVARQVPAMRAVAAAHAEAAATLAGGDALALINASNASAGATFHHRGLDQTRAVQIAGQTRTRALRKLFDELPEHAGVVASRALEAGVTLGRNPLVVARDITHALGGNRARAQTIARTEALRAYREASLDTWRRQGGVHQWQWFSTLDRTACPVCWAMHGTLHPISETMGSHPACRCTALPVPDGVPPPISPSDTGEQRFEGLDYARQREILGPRKHDAYLAGDLHLRDVVATEHNPRWGLVRRERTYADAVRPPRLAAPGDEGSPPFRLTGASPQRVHDAAERVATRMRELGVTLPFTMVVKAARIEDETAYGQWLGKEILVDSHRGFPFAETVIAHELGHAIDGYSGRASESTSGPWHHLVVAYRQSTASTRVERSSPRDAAYWRRPREVWARAVQQYLAVDDDFVSLANGTSPFGDVYWRFPEWPAIADAVEAVLTRQGMMSSVPRR